MKAKIIIEQFSNGISLKWSSPGQLNKAVVALDYDKQNAIGKMIWDDVKNIMDAELCNIVTLNIEYGTENTNQEVEADSQCGLLGGKQNHSRLATTP